MKKLSWEMEVESKWRLTQRVGALLTSYCSKETISIQLNPTNLKVFGAQWQERREGLLPYR